MKSKRLEILKDNEENLQEETEKLQKKEGDSDEEGDEVTGNPDDFEDEEEDTLNKVNKFKKAKQEQKDEEEEGEDEDSDYELEGGDLAIYDSNLDDVDELLYVRDTLEKMNQADASHVAQLLSGLVGNDLQIFNECMQGAQQLKEREELINKQLDEIMEKKYGKQ